MNWEALGAIAELLGAVAVVFSLVYLARQINSSSEVMRQNTESVRATGGSSSMEHALQIYRAQIDSHEMSEIARKGHAGGELNSTEKHRYALLLLGIFEAHQTYFLQNVRGTAPPETLEYYGRVFDKVCTLPGVVKWWKSNRDPFDPGFKKYMESKIARNNQTATN